MSKITNVFAREILDSRGNPTLEAIVELESGLTAAASVPSGASTGAHEAHELRDMDTKRYHGLGVLQAIANVETELREAIVGKEVEDQKRLDAALIERDGTTNKSRLGANAIVGLSLACARAAALEKKIPLYQSLATLTKRKKQVSFPIPAFNVLNGGKHSDSGLSVQEFKIIPSGIATYPEQLRAGSEIFHSLQKLLARHEHSTAVGDEGGFAPHLDNHTQALELLELAVTEAGYTLGRDVFLGLDVAANSFYDEREGVYWLKPENVKLTKESLVNMYRDWMQKFSIVSIEDGLVEDDFDGWANMLTKLTQEPATWNRPALIIGDDLLVTNTTRLRKAIAAKACNAVLIKPNQIGTVSETIECVELAQKHHYATMISHRSGDTPDDFIADLAVGVGASHIKSGSLSRGERLAKYNRLLAIWAETHPLEGN